MIRRIHYLIWATMQSLRFGAVKTTCPACGESNSRIVRRKYGVTALRECGHCSIRFRTPRDAPATADTFYADEVYKQGFTTDLPSNAQLHSMLQSGFAGTERDFSGYIEALQASGLAAGARILDFGCSWGYGSWQMAQAGFDVFAYEIGRERARYARDKLKCKVVENVRTLDRTIDCFFSAHVIEHLTDPTRLFDEARQTLRPGGLFFCYCPNGALEREEKHCSDYHRNWGKVHPLMITPAFMKREMERHGFTRCALFSSPVDSAAVKALTDGKLDGAELLVIARKQG